MKDKRKVYLIILIVVVVIAIFFIYYLKASPLFSPSGIELRGDGPWFFTANGFSGEYEFLVAVSRVGDCYHLVFITGPPYKRVAQSILCPPVDNDAVDISIDAGGTSILLELDLKTDGDYVSMGVTATNPSSGVQIPVTFTPL